MERDGVRWDGRKKDMGETERVGSGHGKILPGTQWPPAPPKHTVSLPLAIACFGHILTFTQLSVLS